MRLAIFFQFLIISCSSLLCLTGDVRSSNGNLVTVGVSLPKLDPRIVNGTKATPVQFPHQVSLRRSYSDVHFCGGSVIADQWILTAAHCMFKNGGKISPWSIKVVAGQIQLNQSHEFSQKRAVGAIIMHSNFDLMTLTNDIALLQLTTPLKLNTSYVKAAKLQKIIPKPGTECLVCGWGYLAEKRKIISNDLMYVSLPLVKPARCKELLVNVTHLPPGMFCAGYEEGLRDACQGDSGGSMMCDNVLTGVVSGGEGCALPALPGLYSDVPYYRHWIENQIKNFNGTASNSTNMTNGYVTPRPHGRNSSSGLYSNLSFYLLVIAYTLLSYVGVVTCNKL